MKKILSALAIILIIFSGKAQKQEPCAFDSRQRELEAQNPAIKKAREESQARVLHMNVAEYVKKLGIINEFGKTTTIYEVPVVVHIIVPTGVAIGSAGNPTDAEITTWIDNANKMYATTFGGNFPVAGTATGGASGTVIPFKLVLAKRNPNCAATTGIMRYNPNNTNYDTYGIKDALAAATYTTANMRTLAPHWPESSYYNMYIIKGFDGNFSNSGLMGWASPPANPDSVFETVMKSPVVTKLNDTTLGHEFMHSLGVEHPFGNASSNGGGTGTTNCPTSTGVCTNDDDKICDTQATKSLLGVFPVPSNTDINPCTSTVFNGVQYNIMNYTSDERYFTPGQRDYALATFMPLRASLTTSLGSTTPATGAATVAATTCIPPTTVTVTGNAGFGPTLVKIGTINNPSDGSNTSNSNLVYYDYTAQSCLNNIFKTNLAVASNPQTINLQCKTNDNTFSVWIDYNNNSTFESSELVVTDQNVVAGTQTPFQFTIPSTGVVLNTPLRMRVIGDAHDILGPGGVVTGTVANSTAPCGQRNAGQVEDYQVTITSTALGTSNVSATENLFTIYPNPSNDGKFYIKTKNANQDVAVEITDASGRLISKSSNKANNGIVTKDSKLKSGVYFVKIQSGNSVQTEKLIVK